VGSKRLSDHESPGPAARRQRTGRGPLRQDVRATPLPQSVPLFLLLSLALTHCDQPELPRHAQGGASGPAAGTAEPGGPTATATARPRPGLPVPAVKAELTATLTTSDLSRTESLPMVAVKNVAGPQGTKARMRMRCTARDRPCD